MGADLSVNTSPRNVKSVHKKLAELYSRRSAVESLIRYLESYAACQAKDERRARLKSA
jgi:DNA-binding SARP family transcriptional activator